MSNPTLIDRLLEDQRSLTAVDAFSRWHEQELGRAHPAEDRYRELIPATPPLPGQQYAFEVDMDRCSGCKACVTACHALNGLEDGETWRRVGLLVTEPAPVASSARLPAPAATPAVWQLHVTTACHHCVDPGCLNGCPVLAYDKDPITGIVRHLDDQCMGCNYCVMKCPYEVPQYSERLGIVRKCDLCADRLAVGEAPACAQACPNEAIRITVVEQEEIVAQRAALPGEDGAAALAPAWNLPASPDPRQTLPTTQYRSRHRRPGLIAADHATLRVEPAHWPLVWMLLLTQAATGVFAASWAIGWRFGNVLGAPLAVLGTALLSAGLAAAVFHLGRPAKAWRSFLGWRQSWLSREIIAFNLFAAAAASVLVSLALGAPHGVAHALNALTAKLGLLGVFCSAMVYVDTGRPFWAPHRVFAGFLGSAVLLGLTLAGALMAWISVRLRVDVGSGPQATAAAALILRSALFLWEAWENQRARRQPEDPCHFNAVILHTRLADVLSLRAALSMLATVGGLFSLFSAGDALCWWMSATVVTTFAGELAGRYLFFAGSAARRMPGGVSP